MSVGFRVCILPKKLFTDLSLTMLMPIECINSFNLSSRNSRRERDMERERQTERERERENE